MMGFLGFLKRKRLANPINLENLKSRSDSTSGDESTEHDEAPWLATTLLDNVPITEKDWWASTNQSIEDEKDDSSGSTVASSSNKDWNGSTDTCAGETTFHNRGFEIWEECRSVWRDGSMEDDGERVSPSLSTASPRKPLSNKQKERIIQNVTKQREYKLPRRLRLDELIQAYNDAWYHDSE